MIITLTLVSITSMAATCDNIQNCIKLASKLTNTGYTNMINNGGMAHKVNMIGINLTADNIDFYLSQNLNAAGFTRIYHAEQKQYIVISARDVRYNPVKQYAHGEELPHTYDYVSALIKLKSTPPKSVVRTFRPFMSRYGRIMPLENNKTILIQDTAMNIKRLKALIEKTDIPEIKLSNEEKKRRKEQLKHRRKLDLIRAGSCNKKS